MRSDWKLSGMCESQVVVKSCCGCLWLVIVVPGGNKVLVVTRFLMDSDHHL